MNTLETLLKPINGALATLDLTCESDASNLVALRAEVLAWEAYSFGAFRRLANSPEGAEFEGLTSEQHAENWRKCAKLIELIDEVPAKIKALTKETLTRLK